MTCDDFYARFHPERRDGAVVVREPDQLDGVPQSRLWTIVACDDQPGQPWVLMPGYHFVNRLGYIVTEEHWVDGADDVDDFYVDA